MTKKSKKLMLILGGVIVLVLCVAFFFPRVMVWHGIQRAYEEGFAPDFGETAKDFTEYDVTDDSLVMINFPHFTIGLPTYFEDQTTGDSDLFIYRTAGATEEDYSNCEAIAFNPQGNDNTDITVLNPEVFNTLKMNRLINGYEQLGYGIPDNSYNSLKCAFSITEEDYSFWNYNKSLAYMYLVPGRTAGFAFYSDGIISHTYIYETEDKCALLNESYNEARGLYSYKIEVYNPNDLNRGYVFALYVEKPETAYAIINSIKFNE